jgi:FkbM family methyltransferase
MFKKLIFNILGRRNTKNLYYKLANKKSYFSEAEIILDYFYTYQRKGLMVDVGVHFGESCLPYSELGWNIIGFEPDPKNRSKIPPIPNLKLYQDAVSNKDGEILMFYGSEESSGISSLSSFHATHRPIAQVKTTTLSTILDKENISQIDFLKIDIEGHDLFALKGFPFDKYSPEVILCEFEDYKTVPVGYTYKDLGNFLLEKNYEVYLSEWKPIIKYGSQHEWRNIRLYPIKLEDARGWGNYIAVQKGAKVRFEKVLNQYLQSFNTKLSK